jgi:hypothetical protein
MRTWPKSYRKARSSAQLQAIRFRLAQHFDKAQDRESTDFKPGVVRGYRTAVTTVVCFGV